jgi:enterochelin esterase-like enzyme
MGGAGALQLGFNHPDVFGVIGAHSPALHLDDGTFLLYGTGLDFAQREPIDLAAHAPGMDKLKIWIDAGEDDPWLERDELLDAALTQRGIAHTWRIMAGGHEGAYWTNNSAAYLRFYNKALSS